LAAAVIAGKAAHGLAMRFGLGALETLVAALFLLFLAVLGFQLLDWIATRGGHLLDALPLPRRAGWPTEWSVGAAIGWGLCLAAALPLLLSGNLHGRLGIAPGTLPAKAVALGIGLLTLLAVTLAEEAIARGYAFQRLMGAVGVSWGALLGSFGFAVALVWAQPPRNLVTALLVGTLFGLALAMAWLRTHALWVGWGLHFGYRAVMALILGLPIAGHGDFPSLADTYTTGPRWLNGGAFGLDAALLTALFMLVAMAVLYRATREYAWHYTAPVLVPAGYEVTVAPPPAHTAMERQMERQAAVAPSPLVQILPATPQSRSASDTGER
jgi:membrane protease YdiL (CAAX protease family)